MSQKQTKNETHHLTLCCKDYYRYVGQQQTSNNPLLYQIPLLLPRTHFCWSIFTACTNGRHKESSFLVVLPPCSSWAGVRIPGIHSMGSFRLLSWLAQIDRLRFGIDLHNDVGFTFQYGCTRRMISNYIIPKAACSRNSSVSNIKRWEGALRWRLGDNGSRIISWLARFD